MNQLAEILEYSALLGGGAVLWHLVIWWKRRSQKRAGVLEAEGLQAKAQQEAENLVRDARLTANEEAMKLRDQVEQALAAGRAERLELERRLGEREVLINSQLSRIVEAEKNL